MTHLLPVLFFVLGMGPAVLHAVEPLPPPPGWSWNRPVPTHAKREGDALYLRTEQGRVWAGGGNQNRLMSEKPVDGESHAIIDVALLDAQGKYEQCGILLYGDDENFVKLVVEHIDQEHFVVAGFEFDKKRKVMAKIKIDGTRAKLKLQVNGHTVTAFRQVGSDWKQLAEVTWTPGKVRHFAVFSQDGDPEKPRWARVYALEVEP